MLHGSDRFKPAPVLRRRLPLAVGLLAVLSLGTLVAADPPPLTLVQTIPIPGVEGRIDHFDLDMPSQRLYVAALGNNTVEVIDLAIGTVVHHITGLKEPQGVAIVPDPHVLVIANGDDGSVAIYDAATYALVRTVSLSGDADNVRYDRDRRMVYVGFGSGGIAAIDPATGTVAKTMPLSGHPEAFVLESGGSRIFVNVPGSSQIAVLDRATSASTVTWDLGKGYSGFFASMLGRVHANFPMALDDASHRLFIGCRSPARMLVFDTVAGIQVTQIDISGDIDDLFYDQAARRIMASCGDGCIDMIEQTDPDHYRRSAVLPTAAGARTSWWVPETRRLYLAVPHRGSQAAAVQVFQVRP